jgi:outer membrane protein assembly factor BamB
MGFGRQNGQFACLNVADGSLRWNMEIGASCSDPAVCDIDGDGRQEFIFGTSHGMLYAVGDEDRKPHVLWNVQLDAGLGAPILADIDGDGKSDIVIPAEDGTVRVFGAGR